MKATKDSAIRVLIADDSATVRRALSDVIESQPDMTVVGAVASGARAVAEVLRLRPDLITMDVSMPGLDGVDATREIMRKQPTPIVIVTASELGPTSMTAFRALAAGAVDVMAKPDGSALKTSIAYRRLFVDNLKAVARATGRGTLVRERLRRSSAPRMESGVERLSERPPVSLVAIGASTGGPQCLRVVLSRLRRPSAPPVLLVQHMSDEFLGSFVSWLDSVVDVDVLAARNGLPVEPGRVYVAPGGRHLKLGGPWCLELSDELAVQHQRPSVDTLFESVAEYAAPGALGVLLTGMGRDGARGLLRMREAGCQTVVQNQESCIVFGMPAAALELGAAPRAMAPEAIAQWLGGLRVSEERAGDRVAADAGESP